MATLLDSGRLIDIEFFEEFRKVCKDEGIYSHLAAYVRKHRESSR